MKLCVCEDGGGRRHMFFNCDMFSNWNEETYAHASKQQLRVRTELYPSAFCLYSH